MIATAPWAGRSGHTTVVDGAAGAIYVIGGCLGYGGCYRGSDYTFFQDVWVSADGGARPDRTRAKWYSSRLVGSAHGVHRMYRGVLRVPKRYSGVG